jgi:hypothetical protein
VPVTLHPPVGPAGTFVTAQGCGFIPGSQVLVSWDQQAPLTSTTVNPDGTFTASFTVPQAADQGPHQVVFSQGCVSSCVRQVASATFTVTEE